MRNLRSGIVYFALAFLLRGQSPAQSIASHDPVSGSVYAAMLALFALMPLLLARMGGRSPESRDA
jgi:hypothetical protein